MRTLARVVLLGMVAACGGGVNAASPGSGEVSHVKIQVNLETPPQIEAFDGPAFGFYDPAHKTFHLIVVDASTEPKPTCAMFAKPALTKGGFVDFWASSHLEVGKFGLLDALVLRADPTTPSGKVTKGIPRGPQIDVKAVGSSSFDVELVKIDPGAPGSGSGEMRGVICPDGSLGVPGAGEVPAGAW